MLIFFLVLATLVVLIIWHYFENREMYQLIAKLPGPKGFPLFGIAIDVLNLSQVDAFQYMFNLAKKYGPFFSVQVGPLCAVLLSDPRDVEIVLSSRKFIEKSDEYKPFDEWLGTGLFVSTGAKWHSMRKLLTPAFHFNILKEYVKLFDKNSSIFVDRLEKARIAKRNDAINIFEHVELCTLDIICGK